MGFILSSFSISFSFLLKDFVAWLQYVDSSSYSFSTRYINVDDNIVLFFMLGNIWSIDVYGFNVVFFALVTVALGRVSEQVLQGRWI